MAELATIARPYAEAVFRVALENKALTAWSERLSLLSALAADSRMLSCIGNPELSAAQKSELFKSLAGEALEGSEANLIDVLAANERLSSLPEIANLFETLKASQEGVKEATIYSAFPVDATQRKALIADLEARFKTRLTADVVVDQSLIGGVKIVVGDQVLDTSVRGKLESLRLALKN
ncbi:MAG TPA: F0F1 ATP synthase subunit delta [Candidatus Accumulibacter phosphatis]|uniref:F0F1 ATP synthase subunit delta n=1 Tax=Candidatus Accumulibacter sp. ACC005 TaxID=2823331 RepID=UPI0025BF96C8|nr:F0F1 ATP synthase subunit delta [Candidatus Accumulibacter sp. ACC005]HRF13957.1 F0F1 ATP synthase subunit delta [Candidatus Accumulibacter phosphatis]